MNEKFTGAKWEADFEHSLIHAYKENDYLIARVFDVDTPEERKANLRLIASSPEMYLLLRNMLFEFKRGSHTNPEYIKHCISCIEDLLREINSDFDKEPESQKELSSDTEFPDLTVREFAQLVQDMCSSQKRYFKTRDKDALIESKRLEAQVDKYAAEILQEGESEFKDLLSPLQIEKDVKAVHVDALACILEWLSSAIKLSKSSGVRLFAKAVKEA